MVPILVMTYCLFCIDYNLPAKKELHFRLWVHIGPELTKRVMMTALQLS